MRNVQTKHVLVAGVPVTVRVVNGQLSVIVGRFDPNGTPLNVNRLSGTATVTFHVSDESWITDLHPASWRQRGGNGHEDQR